MVKCKPISEKPSILKLSALFLILTGLVLLASCSDDTEGPTAPEEPKTLVEGIAYYDWVAGDLRYVEKTGAFWGNPEVVAYGDEVGLYSSLAFDAQGTPHISYYDRTNEVLMYAIRTEFGWRRMLVDNEGNVGARCAIAIDAEGNPHITYRNATTGRLKYAYGRGDVWSYETINPADPVYGEIINCQSDFGYPTSIDVDATGNPHISYCTAEIKLAYAVKSNGVWSFEIVDSNNVGQDCSLYLDDNGNPHISYLSFTSTPRVKYARKINSQWELDSVMTGDPPNTCPEVTSLAIDAQGNPHISYHTLNGHLAYAVKSSNGNWSVELADDHGVVGRFSSILLDSEGIPHISYMSSSPDVLKYSTKINGEWGHVVIDPKWGTGIYTSLCLCYR